MKIYNELMTVPLRRQQLLQFIKVDGCKYENIYCVNDSLSMIITFFKIC